MKQIRAGHIPVLVLLFLVHSPPAVAQVDQQRVQEYFKECKVLCERDGGRLWGVQICAAEDGLTIWQ